MIQLIIVSIIWAFSFSLIGNFISGKMDIYLAIFIRFSLAALVLLPFFNFSILRKKIAFQLIGIGSLQIGLMYAAYFKSFQYLKVSEVALFTVLTPLYISLLDGILARRFYFKYIISSLLAILGALIIRWGNISSDFLLGLLLIQIANLCFAGGQVFYKHLMSSHKINNREVFFLFYLGALIPVIPLMYFQSDFNKLPNSLEQYGVLLWLGVVASGLGYLLWNGGARIVNSGTLAVMNNAVIPLAILVNLLLFKSQIDTIPFTIGSAVIVLSLFISKADVKETTLPLAKKV